MPEVFFIGGLKVEVKNLIKMFKPKSLKQAYTLPGCKITPSPTGVIASILINKPTSQLHMLTKTKPTPHPITTKAY